MLQLISLLMENKPGALMRVTGVLTARGYNIESLTVARTLDPELSRMSIVVDVEPSQRSQVIKQMNKLINVLQAADLTEGAAVRRELVLVMTQLGEQAFAQVAAAYPGGIQLPNHVKSSRQVGGRELRLVNRPLGRWGWRRRRSGSCCHA